MTVLTYQEQLHCAKELEVKGTDNLVKEDGWMQGELLAS